VESWGGGVGGGELHGLHYIVKYTFDNHGKSMRKRQERRTRAENDSKKQINREKKKWQKNIY
jgi:hypothetical protein